jgi:L-rhamnose isomerase
VAAWVIGARNMAKALLLALLAPIDELKKHEARGDYTSRLALMEETKLLPAGAVWDYYCHKMDVPIGETWLAEIKNYERTVLAKRS